MSLPIPVELLEKCLGKGGTMDMRKGRLIIVSDLLSPELQKELEKALADYIAKGLDQNLH